MKNNKIRKKKQKKRLKTNLLKRRKLTQKLLTWEDQNFIWKDLSHWIIRLSAQIQL